MTKKTKKQKKKADNRKKRRPAAPIFNDKKTVKTKLSTQNVGNVEDQRLKTATLQDFKKTAFLTLALFALEILFFYANLKGITHKLLQFR